MLFSRLGVYIPLPGVDVGAFASSIKTEGLLGYIDTLSGGSISRVGIFSLGGGPAVDVSCTQCQVRLRVGGALQSLTVAEAAAAASRQPT